MMWTIGAIGFVIALALTVAVHELEHLVAAKKVGLGVPQYFVASRRWTNAHRFHGLNQDSSGTDQED